MSYILATSFRTCSSVSRYFNIFLCKKDSTVLLYYYVSILMPEKGNSVMCGNQIGEEWLSQKDNIVMVSD